MFDNFDRHGGVAGKGGNLVQLSLANGLDAGFQLADVLSLKCVVDQVAQSTMIGAVLAQQIFGQFGKRARQN